MSGRGKIKFQAIWVQSRNTEPLYTTTSILLSLNLDSGVGRRRRKVISLSVGLCKQRNQSFGYFIARAGVGLWGRQRVRCGK